MSTPETDSGFTNRRRERRSRSFKSGKLIFGGFNVAVVDCLIIEMSAAGIRVETSVMMQVPEIVLLRFSDGTEREMRRSWARGNEIGLEFLPEKG